MISSITITKADKLVSTSNSISRTSSASLIPIAIISKAFTSVVVPSLVNETSVFACVRFIIVNFVHWGTEAWFSICCHIRPFGALSAFLVEVKETLWAHTFILDITPNLIWSTFFLFNLDTVFTDSVESPQTDTGSIEVHLVSPTSSSTKPKLKHNSWRTENTFGFPNISILGNTGFP